MMNWKGLLTKSSAIAFCGAWMAFLPGNAVAQSSRPDILQIGERGLNDPIPGWVGILPSGANGITLGTGPFDIEVKDPIVALAVNIQRGTVTLENAILSSFSQNDLGYAGADFLSGRLALHDQNGRLAFAADLTGESFGGRDDSDLFSINAFYGTGEENRLSGYLTDIITLGGNGGSGQSLHLALGIRAVTNAILSGGRLNAFDFVASLDIAGVTKSLGGGSGGGGGGGSSGGTGAEVPEPASALLLLSALGIGAKKRLSRGTLPDDQ